MGTTLPKKEKVINCPNIRSIKPIHICYAPRFNESEAINGSDTLIASCSSGNIP